MNLKKMHENLADSWLSRQQKYQHEFRSSILSACVLVRHALNKSVLHNATWNTLIKANNQKLQLLEYIDSLSKVDSSYETILTLGLDATDVVQLFTNDEISQIIAYANNINNKDISQLLSVVENLNNQLGNESDNIIKQLINNDGPINVATFGFRILTYLQNNLKITFSSYHLDKLRWREAMLSKIILGRKNDLVYLDDFVNGQLPKWLSQDYCFISANRHIEHAEPEYLNNIC